MQNMDIQLYFMKWLVWFLADKRGEAGSVGGEGAKYPH